MKLALFVLLFTSLSMAGEIQTHLSESHNGLSFSLYEEARDNEEAVLNKFAQSLNQTTMVTTDQNFSFRCVQKLSTNATVETRCTGILREANHPNAFGTFGDDYISITLTGKTAEEFFRILPKQQDMVSIILQKKFILMGGKTQMGITVRH